MLVFDQLQKNDRVLRALAWGIAAGLAVLLVGLYYVQVISAQRFREEQKNQSFRTVRLPASRGKILDRRGVVLADNRPSYHVSLYLEDRAIREQFKARYRQAKGNRRLTRDQQAQLARASRYEVVSNLVAELSRVLREPLAVAEAPFTRHYERSLALPFPVLTDLNPQQIARFSESSAIPAGFDLEVRPIRWYPHQTTAAQLLGYLVRDEGSTDEEEMSFNYRLPDYTGIAGIEFAFNDDLKGKPGAKSVQVNNLGYRQSEIIWSPVESGQNVHLTIDLSIQKAAEVALSQALNEARGAAVVMDVRNGDLLALASAPAFDPNVFIPSVSWSVWTNLNDEKLRPLPHRAMYGTYPLGSIFKIVVGLAALEAGWDPTNIITSPGYAEVGQSRHRIEDLAPPGDYDFRRGFLRSCNKYFVDTGLWVGLDRIVAMGQRFHFGEKTGIELRPESAGVLPTREWIRDNRGAWFDGDTANLSIGQGDVTVTPLQVACMVTAVANGGTVFTPRLVDRVEPPDAFDQRPRKAFAPGRIRSQIGVSAHSLSLLREAMLADVEDPEGTGHDAFHRGRHGPPLLENFRVGAKTGTAEVKKGRITVDKITWFASYGPCESPRYAVVVMVESGGGGGTTCGRVAQKIYQAIQAREKAGALGGIQAVAAISGGGGN
ncbi:MAG: penicillin-binding protein 2 [Verrucomicrobia bacterium]|nr:penicillin-binding protein 2 [Verrucomicrobiota bacterium]